MPLCCTLPLAGGALLQGHFVVVYNSCDLFFWYSQHHYSVLRHFVIVGSRWVLCAVSEDWLLLLVFGILCHGVVRCWPPTPLGTLPLRDRWFAVRPPAPLCDALLPSLSHANALLKCLSLRSSPPASQCRAERPTPFALQSAAIVRLVLALFSCMWLHPLLWDSVRFFPATLLFFLLGPGSLPRGQRARLASDMCA